jgi:hypothetical protein
MVMGSERWASRASGGQARTAVRSNWRSKRRPGNSMQPARRGMRPLPDSVPAPSAPLCEWPVPTLGIQTHPVSASRSLPLRAACDTAASVRLHARSARAHGAAHDATCGSTRCTLAMRCVATRPQRTVPLQARCESAWSGRVSVCVRGCVRARCLHVPWPGFHGSRWPPSGGVVRRVRRSGWFCVCRCRHRLCALPRAQVEGLPERRAVARTQYTHAA